MTYNNSLSERFWKNVNIKEDSECWEWLKSTNKQGYGHLNINNKLCRANRIAYKISYGIIPSGLCVLHTCDNPLCVNPNHLWLGTHNDNMRDKVLKGRCSHLKEELNPNSKLTKIDVLTIRNLYDMNGYTQYKLAELYNVTRSCIKHVVNKDVWKNI